jgi:hypothetical protein
MLGPGLTYSGQGKIALLLRSTESTEKWAIAGEWIDLINR